MPTGFKKYTSKLSAWIDFIERASKPPSMLVVTLGYGATVPNAGSGLLSFHPLSPSPQARPSSSSTLAPSALRRVALGT